MSTSLSSIGAITLFVGALPRSKSFYQEVFSLPIVFEDENSAVYRTRSSICSRRLRRTPVSDADSDTMSRM